MKNLKTIALTGTLAIAASLMGNAFAADTAPAASPAHAKCEKEAKDKKLMGDAAKAAVTKCEADAAKAAAKK